MLKIIIQVSFRYFVEMPIYNRRQDNNLFIIRKLCSNRVFQIVYLKDPGSSDIKFNNCAWKNNCSGIFGPPFAFNASKDDQVSGLSAFQFLELSIIDFEDISWEYLSLCRMGWLHTGGNMASKLYKIVNEISCINICFFH